MFLSGWFQKKEEEKEPSKAELTLAQIQNLLFPPLELKTDDKNLSYHVDRSIDGNLYSVLLELEEGLNDELTQNTLKKSLDSIRKAREILNVYHDLNPEAKYIVVDNVEDKNNFTL